MKAGVLALQGDVREHLHALERCGARALPVRYPEEIRACDALILPGGESTTMGKLISRFGLAQPLLEFAQAGRPLMGTCAGAILLADKIDKNEQFRLGLMAITIQRNAYGRQVDSFEADLQIPMLGDAPLRGVFIRAPQISEARAEVEILARHQESIVLCRQKNLLACAFHPELTDDLRLHQYFLAL